MVAGARKNVCNVVIGGAQSTGPAYTGPASIFRSEGQIPIRRENTNPENLNQIVKVDLKDRVI